METIMRHGGWRNESCAKAYIEDSLAYKLKTGNMIQRAIRDVSLLSTSSIAVLPSTTEGISGPSNTHIAGLSTNGGIAEPHTTDVIVVPSTNGGFDEPTTTHDIDAPSIELSAVKPTLILAQTDSTGDNSAAESLMYFDNDPFLDSTISDDDFIDIVDQVSQSHQELTQTFIRKSEGGAGEVDYC
ncbi:hypothetical protein HA402_013484 [Bradysia odoriphaga]|nr:hypothetical protein HA402_013484 [Bradysia odoriphaga]